MAITPSTSLKDLQSVFDKVKRIYYSEASIESFATAPTIKFELPVIEDSFNFNAGAASISYIKLTTGQKWASYVTAGDPDITMQVASVDEEISGLFMEKVGEATTTSTLTGTSLTGQGYSTEIKKVTGALILASEDGTKLIVLPNVEMIANPVIESGTPAYFNVQIMPKPNTAGADIIILNPTPPGG